MTRMYQLIIHPESDNVTGAVERRLDRHHEDVRSAVHCAKPGSIDLDIPRESLSLEGLTQEAARELGACLASRRNIGQVSAVATPSVGWIHALQRRPKHLAVEYAGHSRLVSVVEEGPLASVLYRTGSDRGETRESRLHGESAACEQRSGAGSEGDLAQGCLAVSKTAGIV